jgi:hypothetical protein
VERVLLGPDRSAAPGRTGAGGVRVEYPLRDDRLDDVERVQRVQLVHPADDLRDHGLLERLVVPDGDVLRRRVDERAGQDVQLDQLVSTGPGGVLRADRRVLHAGGRVRRGDQRRRCRPVPRVGSWRPQAVIDPGHQLEAVSCPTASYCLTADEHGFVTAGTAH